MGRSEASVAQARPTAKVCHFCGLSLDDGLCPINGSGLSQSGETTKARTAKQRGRDSRPVASLAAPGWPDPGPQSLLYASKAIQGGGAPEVRPLTTAVGSLMVRRGSRGRPRIMQQTIKVLQERGTLTLDA